MTTDAAPQTGSRRRLLWTTVVGAWVVLLVVLAVWSAHNDPPTVRDQTSITSAKDTIDGTVREIASVLPQDWRLRDGGYVDGTCELTVARDGVSTIRVLELSGPAQSEESTLRAIADKLGEARLTPGEGTPTGFFLDAGNYVAVRGKVTDTGALSVELRSGCRSSD